MLASSPSQLVNPFSLNRRAGFGTGAGGDGGVVYPVDLFTAVAPLMVCGTEALTASAVGTEIAVIRKNSDGTNYSLTPTATGKADPAAVLAALGSVPAYPAREGYYSKLNDQTGNARHPVQATTGSQPSYLLLPDGTITCSLRGAIGSFGGFLTIPDGFLTGRNWTVFMVFSSDDWTASGRAEEAGMVPNFAGIRSGAFYDGVYGRSNPATKQSTAMIVGSGVTDYFLCPSNSHFQVLSVKSNATNIRLSLNGQFVQTQTAASGNGAMTSMRIGKLDSGSLYSNAANLVALLLYPDMTDGQQDQMIGLLKQRFRIGTWTKNVIVMGHSIAAGHEETLGGFQDLRWTSYPEQWWRTRGDNTILLRNRARSGRKIADLTADITNKFTPLISASVFGTENHAFVDIGINDLAESDATGKSAATLYSELMTLKAALTTAGANTVTFVTQRPAETLSGTEETKRLAFNALVMAGSGVDFDCAVDAAAKSWAYGTHYQGSTPNRIHPNSAGNTLMVEAMEETTSLPF